MIFFCQKLVKIFTAVGNGEIPINLVFSLLWLSIPEMAQLILPLSLFLGLLMTFSNLRAANEITVMHACGMNKISLVKVAMVLALFTGIILSINVMWIYPLSSRRQNQVLTEAKTNPIMWVLTQGQFKQISNSNSVLFVQRTNGNYFNDIFLAQFHSKSNIPSSIVKADFGALTNRKDGSQVITLREGTHFEGIYFEGTAILRNFCITDFQNYQATISYQTSIFNPSDMEHMDICTLINSNTHCARAELHWRLTLIFAVFMMALMVVPLSMMNLYQDSVIPTLLSMLFYLVFFLLQTVIKSNGGKGKIDLVVWAWAINSFYLLFGIGLNLWDTEAIHRLRAKFIDIL